MARRPGSLSGGEAVEDDDGGPGDEASDVCPESDADLVGHSEGEEELDNLEEEVKAENIDGVELEDGDDEGHGENADAAVGEEEQVGSEDTGDGPAGADEGGLGALEEEPVGEGGEDAGDEVEPEVFHVPEAVFKGTAENPKEGHVSREVKDAGVHKHGGEDGPPSGNRSFYVKGSEESEAKGFKGLAARELSGDESPGVEEADDGGTAATEEEGEASDGDGVEENQSVEGQQAHSDRGAGAEVEGAVGEGDQGE